MDAINDAMAFFFAHAAIQKQRLKCKCPGPAPGVFDELYWTTCQHCQRALSVQMCIERRGNQERKRP